MPLPSPSLLPSTALTRLCRMAAVVLIPIAKPNCWHTEYPDIATAVSAF